MMDKKLADQWIAKAEKKLKSLAGEEIPALSLNSLDASEAPFLGQIVSKLSPMIGNLLENRIVNFLNETRDDDHYWVRQDPDFPDALLKATSGIETGVGFEVKAWYALSTELTGRFRESVNLLSGKNIKVVVVSWMMSHVVYGTPKILDVLVVDALEVAKSRDNHYHKPPDYVINEPNDTTARTRNLQQTNVLGYKWQETDIKQSAEAHRFVKQHSNASSDPHTPEAQALVDSLMNTFKYRLDTNFAKIDRIDNPEIEAFKSKVLAMTVRDKTLTEWQKLLSKLNSESEVEAAIAGKIVQSIYDEL